MTPIRCAHSSVVTEPSVEPVTLAEAKTFLRVSDTTDDALITSLITAARARAESYTRRTFVYTTRDLCYPCLFDFAQPISVPFAPLASITSVKYYDEDATIQTLDSGSYLVKASAGAFAGRGYIEIEPFADLPILTTYMEYPVVVRAVCGYGSTAASVPDGIKHAILFMVGDMYEQRQESVVGVMVGKAAITAQNLLAPYRLIEAA